MVSYRHQVFLTLIIKIATAYLAFCKGADMDQNLSDLSGKHVFMHRNRMMTRTGALLSWSTEAEHEFAVVRYVVLSDTGESVIACSEGNSDPNLNGITNALSKSGLLTLRNQGQPTIHVEEIHGRPSMPVGVWI
jgi:hypothetical protein